MFSPQDSFELTKEITAYFSPKLLLVVHFRTQNETRIFHRICPGGQLSLKTVQERRGPLQGFQDRGTGERGMRQRPCSRWACPAARTSFSRSCLRCPLFTEGMFSPGMELILFPSYCIAYKTTAIDSPDPWQILQIQILLALLRIGSFTRRESMNSNSLLDSGVKFKF